MSITFANNAATTLAGAISNTSLTCAVAAGSGVLFPPVTTASGNYFVMTFTDAATGLLREIVHCTNVSGDTLTIVRAQEGTTALNWLAGDLADNLWTAGSVSAVIAGARQLLTSNTTFYVNASTGSDSNNGTSSGTAWRTLTHAWQVVQESFDLAGFVVTINCTGAFTSGLLGQGALAGATQDGSSLIFAFAAGSSISVTAASAFSLINGAAATIEGTVTLSASGSGVGQGIGISANNGSAVVVNTNGVIFGACTVSHIWSAQSSQISVIGNYEINGSSQFHCQCSGASFLGINSVTVTLVGTPAFSTSYINTYACGVSNVNGQTFVGSATGSRYSVSQNGVINTAGGGASYFPGSSVGTSSSGGQYL